MHEARTPGDQFSGMVDGSHQINVGCVQGRRIWVIEQKDVALFDVAFEAPDDRLAGFRGTGQVMQEADAAHQQRAVRPIERHHQVVSLIGDGAAGHVLEGNDRFFHNPKQAMADDRKRNRIHERSPAHTGSIRTLR
jgi:hypothetical protein